MNNCVSGKEWEVQVCRTRKEEKVRTKKKKIEKKHQRHQWVWPRQEDGSKLCAKCAIHVTTNSGTSVLCKKNSWPAPHTLESNKVKGQP